MPRTVEQQVRMRFTRDRTRTPAAKAHILQCVAHFIVSMTLLQSYKAANIPVVICQLLTHTYALPGANHYVGLFGLMLTIPYMDMLAVAVGVAAVVEQMRHVASLSCIHHVVIIQGEHIRAGTNQLIVAGCFPPVCYTWPDHFPGILYHHVLYRARTHTPDPAGFQCAVRLGPDKWT